MFSMQAILAADAARFRRPWPLPRHRTSALQNLHYRRLKTGKGEPGKGAVLTVSRSAFSPKSGASEQLGGRRQSQTVRQSGSCLPPRQHVWRDRDGLGRQASVCQRWSKTEPFRAVTMAQFSTVTDTVISSYPGNAPESFSGSFRAPSISRAGDTPSLGTVATPTRAGVASCRQSRTRRTLRLNLTRAADQSNSPFRALSPGSSQLYRRAFSQPKAACGT